MLFKGCLCRRDDWSLRWCPLCSMIFRGLPEGIAQMRREKTTELVMFGPRITLQRYRRRLIEVRCRRWPLQQLPR